MPLQHLATKIKKIAQDIPLEDFVSAIKVYIQSKTVAKMGNQVLIPSLYMYARSKGLKMEYSLFMEYLVKASQAGYLSISKPNTDEYMFLDMVEQPTKAVKQKPSNAGNTEWQANLESFAKYVKAVARNPGVKKFGDDRAFIWSVYENIPEADKAGMDYSSFQKHLIDALRKGLVRLTRADMVGAMDQTLVEKSQTGNFHFIVIE